MKAVLEAMRDELDAERKVVDAKLRGYPRAGNGLTLDSAKNTEEWKADRAKSARLFAAVRELNAKISRVK